MLQGNQIVDKLQVCVANILRFGMVLSIVVYRMTIKHQQGTKMARRQTGESTVPQAFVLEARYGKSLFLTQLAQEEYLRGLSGADFPTGARPSAIVKPLKHIPTHA
jgi:hypothetical protein